MQRRHRMHWMAASFSGCTQQYCRRTGNRVQKGGAQLARAHRPAASSQRRCRSRLGGASGGRRQGPGHCGLRTCPPLVTTDLYHRHFTLNLLSVWPSAGTSSAGGAAVSGVDQNPGQVYNKIKARTRPQRRTCGHSGAVGPSAEHIGLQRHAADGRLALQPSAEDVNGAGHSGEWRCVALWLRGV